jgi:ferric-dicitrate binding protein FerR (iron transport regulator)
MDKKNNIQLLEQFFNGTINKQEVHQLLEELKNDEFEKDWMQAQWDQAPDIMNKGVQKQIMDNIKADILPTHTFRWKQWLVAAASLLLVFTTSLSAYLLYDGQNKKLADDMTVTVEKGQKVALTLPDKSRVWVNSGSTLIYGSRFNKHERIIQLDGEAYFEVAKNKNAPFIVQSHGFSVEALGTAFDVKAYQEEKQISAVLIHGEVKVGDELNKINLTPNQKVTYNRENKSMQKNDIADALIYADWRYNKLTFNSERFENIASVLERNYNVKFVFEAQSLKKYRYSGSINNTSLESLLQIFAMTSPISYHMKDSVIYMNENKRLMPFYKKVLK